jgi:hypothetical protein
LKSVVSTPPLAADPYSAARDGDDRRAAQILNMMFEEFPHAADLLV